MNILPLTISLMLFQLTPLAVIVLAVLALATGLLTHYVMTQLERGKTRMPMTPQEVMQNALKISGGQVVLYDLHQQYVYKINGEMLPDEGLDIEEFKKHVHPDDLDIVVQGIQSIRKGECQISEFTYRWNFDYSGKEPRWGWLNNTSVAEFVKGHTEPVAIISTLVDETKLRQHQQEEEELSKKYKQIFEESIVGLSFYTADGWLLNANRIMREICHFDNESSDGFFSNNNLFDLSPFSEVVDRQHLEEYWFCSLSVVPERDMHIYLEIRLHPIYDDGKLAYIAITARDISEERDLYRQVRANEQQIQQANQSMELYETELRYMMEACDIQPWRITLAENRIDFYHGLSKVGKSFTLQQLRSVFVNQDDEFVCQLDNPEEMLSKPLSYVGQILPMVSDHHAEPQWVQVNSIPEYDEQGRLEGAFGVWRNITQLMSKQEQLRNETERAKDSGHQKSVFLANMTHEIRTPLNAIVGFSDVLQMLETTDERREMIRVIHNNSDMLLRLINDMLVLSDCKTMQIVPQKTDFAKDFTLMSQTLQQRVNDSLPQSGLLTGASTVEFQIDNPYQSCIVTLDKSRIQQVFTNFVTNAVKYTTEGHIRVGYRQMNSAELTALTTHPSPLTTSDGIYFYCEDTGTGIPKDKQDTIFDRFVKLNDFVQGTGLGLSICKVIADACHGTIGVQSEGEGQGSTFWMWLPTEVEIN